jgi:hypothetical protein
VQSSLQQQEEEVEEEKNLPISSEAYRQSGILLVVVVGLPADLVEFDLSHLIPKSSALHP